MVKGLRLKIWDSGFRVQGSNFRDQDLGCCVEGQGPWLSAQSKWFRVLEFEFRIREIARSCELCVCEQKVHQSLSSHDGHHRRGRRASLLSLVQNVGRRRAYMFVRELVTCEKSTKPSRATAGKLYCSNLGKPKLKRNEAGNVMTILLNFLAPNRLRCVRMIYLVKIR